MNQPVSSGAAVVPFNNDSVNSTAFNFLSHINAGVDPRTGFYSASVSFSTGEGNALRGPHFDFSLNYSALNPDNIGFGYGWGLNVSTLNVGSRMLSLASGERFRVDGWDQGVPCTFPDRRTDTFTIVVESGQRATITYNTGVIEILEMPPGISSRMLPIHLIGADGSCLHFDWDALGNEAARLAAITDDDDVCLLSLEYEYAQTRLVLHPDAPSQTQMIFHLENDLLVEITQPTLTQYNARAVTAAEEAIWHFGYQKTAGPSFLRLLTEVVQPTGAMEQVQYDVDALVMPPGAPRDTMPAVAERVLYADSSRSEILQISRYDWGHANFYGYPLLTRWDTEVDLLLHWSGNQDFEYGSTETLYDSNDTPLRTLEKTYNRYHLIIREVIRQGNAVQETITNYHDDVALNFEEQPVYFQLPHTVTLNRWLESAPDNISSSTVTSDYDDVGNLIRRRDSATGMTETFAYFPPTGEQAPDGSELCPPDPLGKVWRSKYTVVSPDKRGGPSRHTEYRYCALPVRGGVAKRTNFTLPENYVQCCAETVTAQEGHMTYSLNDSEQTFITDGGAQHGSLLSERITQDGPRDGLTLTRSYAHRLDRAAGTLSTDITVTGHDGLTMITGETRQLLTGLTVSRRGLKNTRVDYDYDALGRLVKEVSMPGTEFEAVTTWQYQLSVGECWQQRTGITGLKHRIELDSLGREVTQKEPQADGQLIVVHTVAYNALGLVSEETTYDPGSEGAADLVLVTRYDYDDWGQVSRTTRPDGVALCRSAIFVTAEGEDGPTVLTRTRTWQETGGLVAGGYTQTDTTADGRSLRSETGEWDASRRTRAVSEERWTYDGLGRCLSHMDAMEYVTRQTWDARDRLETTALPDGAVVSRTYAPGQEEELLTAIRVVHPSLGKDPVTLGTREYDSLGRPMKETVGTATTRWEYDPEQVSAARLILANAQMANMSYEPRLNEAPLKLTLAGNSASTAGTTELTQRYDPKTGLLMLVQGPMGRQSMAYDALGRPTQTSHVLNGDRQRQDQQTLSMGGRLLRVTEVDGTEIVLTYDAVGRLATQTDRDAEVTLTYDGLSRLHTRTLRTPNGGQQVQETLTYDAMGRPVQQTWASCSDAQTWKRTLELAYRADNKVVKRMWIDGEGKEVRTEILDYDLRGRLAKHRINAAQTSDLPQDEAGNAYREQEFDYDALDNLRSLTTTLADGRVNETTYQYAEADPVQLVSIENSLNGYPGYETPRVLKYDVLGNLTDDGRGTQLHYDGLGRLVRVDRQVGLVNYDYAPDGHVGRVTSGSEALYRYWRDDQLNCELREDDGHRFVHAGGAPVAETRVASAVREALLLGTDAQGSVVSEAGKSLAAPVYGVYGERRANGAAARTGFAGELREAETGWYWLGKRLYSPELRRFLSADRESPFGAGGLNRYAYCGGDPINRIDPTGNAWWDWLGVVVGIVGAVVGTVMTGGALAGVVAAAAAGSMAAATSTAATVAMTAGLVLDVVSVVAEVGTGIAMAVGDEKAVGILGWVAFGAGLAPAGPGLARAARKGTEKAGRFVGRSRIGGRSRTYNLQRAQEMINKEDSFKATLTNKAPSINEAPSTNKAPSTKVSHQVTFSAPTRHVEAERLLGADAPKAGIKWSVNDNLPREKFNNNRHTPVPKSGMRKYNDWRRMIKDDNIHPRVAAASFNDFHFEQLKGDKVGEYTIRLSQEHRVAFRITDRVVEVFKIGGHYPRL